jgi:hypothetical protein
MSKRHTVEARDVSEDQAARRLGLAIAEFRAKLANFLARGFPHPDPDTGRFDLVAIDRWCDARHPHLFGGVTMQARDANMVVKDRIERMRAGASRG